MVINVLLVLLILFMVYWWTTQGLFSSFLQLVLTVFSAALALALWEPLVHGFLLHRMPEYAWGTGLLALMALILLLLRFVFDTFVPGNVQFHPLVDQFGGAVGGFLSGVITAGMLMIGLQMAGLPDLMGYEGWTLDNRGRPQRAQSLWISADTITAGLMRRLSDGALNPIGHDRTIGDVHPDLAVASYFFTQSAYPASRRSIRPGAARVLEDGYFSVGSLPDAVAAKLGVEPAGGMRTVVVGTEVVVRATEPDQPSAGDEDGNFRATPAQAALISRANGRGRVAYPIGYVQNQQYRPFSSVNEYAYSHGSLRVTPYWVYRVPQDWRPRHLRLKQLRMRLPESPVETGEALAELIRYGPDDLKEQVADDEKPEPDAPADQPEEAEQFAQVSADLPFALNRNELGSQTVQLTGNALRSGRGSVSRPERVLGDEIAIEKIWEPSGWRIVTVNLGRPGRAESFLGRAVEQAQLIAQPPLLYDTNGNRYFPNGFGVATRTQFTFSIDRDQKMRSLAEVEIGRFPDTAQVQLYYEVPSGITIERFEMGDRTRQLNLSVD